MNRRQQQSHPTVLWFEDRFGIKNNYLSAWLGAIKAAGLDPMHVRRINLHARMRGQLLTKYKNRKAPTWIASRQQEIKDAMMQAVAEHGGSGSVGAIVLSSPESLVCLDMDPEYGTLSRLRGSVYDFMGIPAIVTLPMSAWFTQVNQRDIEMANYGLESEEEMNAYGNAKVSMGLDSQNSADLRTRDLHHFDPDYIRGGDSGHGSGDDDSPAASGGVADDDSADLAVGSNRAVTAEELDDDLFFYVPVMTPVGKVMIQFDMAKTSRIVYGNEFNFWKPK